MIDSEVYSSDLAPREACLQTAGEEGISEATTALAMRLQGVGKELHRRFPETVAVYLFGSRASGRARPDSDVDIAVLTSPSMLRTPRHFLAYYAPLSAVLRTDKIDLVWLNQTRLSLQWQVIRTGQLLFCCDAVALAEFVEQTGGAARAASYYASLSQAWYTTFLAQTYLDKRTPTMLDRQRLMQKIDYIRNTCIPTLLHLAALPTDRFTTDPIALGAAKYYLQTAIEAMLDMANHIVSRRGLGTFETHAKTFATLAEHGILQQEHLETYRQMIGLRNRLVHVYTDIGPTILSGIMTQALGDFDAFIADITRLLVEGT
jgi:uncharacterized protein YutE (UPF0331/DUF86 family)/predicted nucleotidyltransferase